MKKTKNLGLIPPLALACLFLLGIVRVNVSNSAHNAAADRRSHLNVARFLFADFDGDLIPDLAQVEMQNRRSTSTNYFIHLKLAAGVESAIGVSGPDGGLCVAARDVNGDNALDLVVTSNLDANFVEVLLNDGHGNFSLATGDAFSRLGTEPGTTFRGSNAAQAERFSLVLSRFSLEVGIVENGHFDPLSPSRGYSTMESQAALNGSVVRYGSRSPPAAIANS
jgi:hypothetical protein